MILMNHAMMGAAGYQQAAGGGMHPDLHWAFPFWLQTGYEEVVSGQTMTAQQGAPLQTAAGMSFSGNDALLCPGPMPGGAKTIIARILGLSASASQNHGIIDDSYSTNWVAQPGTSFVLRRRSDDSSLLAIPGSCYAAKGNTGALVDFDVALSYGSSVTAYFNGAVASGATSGCAESQSAQVARIGRYYGSASDRTLIGTLAFLYLFTTEMAPAEISAVFASPESVLP